MPLCTAPPLYCNLYCRRRCECTKRWRPAGTSPTPRPTTPSSLVGFLEPCCAAQLLCSLAWLESHKLHAAAFKPHNRQLISLPAAPAASSGPAAPAVPLAAAHSKGGDLSKVLQVFKEMVQKVGRQLGLAGLGLTWAGLGWAGLCKSDGHAACALSGELQPWQPWQPCNAAMPAAPVLLLYRTAGLRAQRNHLLLPHLSL